MPRSTEEQYLAAARNVLLNMLDREYAMTVNEMEARASDRVWNPEIFPVPINPHHFTNARRELAREGVIKPTDDATTSHPEPIRTWSRVPRYGIKTRIAEAAARKRQLTARHAGWSRRGGRGMGLVGRAGENALAAALADPASRLTQPSGSVTNVLGVNLSRWGEVDNTAYYVDVADDGLPGAVTVMFEVKNTRDWYYADDEEVLQFLGKAAVVQAEQPQALVLPVFLARKVPQHPLDARKDGGLSAGVGRAPTGAE